MMRGNKIKINLMLMPFMALQENKINLFSEINYSKSALF